MHARSKIYLGAMLALFVSAAPVQAQSPIVYVSAGGSDSNACTFAAPCRLFQRAVNVVPAGGVVQVLNSAGYGHVTIAKSVTISGGGNIVATGHRIRINGAGAVVVLRGLVMDGQGRDATGILITDAAAVHILDCEIERYDLNGIQLTDTADTQLFITDSVLRENGYYRGSGHGLHVNGEGTTARLTVDNSRFENNRRDGLSILSAESTITRSIATGNGNAGIFQSGGTANIAWTTAANNSNGYTVAGGGQMALESSVARGNRGAGLSVNSGSTVRISNSVFTNNHFGIVHGGGSTVLTRQNNTVSGNTRDVYPTGIALTPLPPT